MDEKWDDNKNREKLIKKVQREELWRIATAIAFLLAMILGVASDKNRR